MRKIERHDSMFAVPSRLAHPEDSPFFNNSQTLAGYTVLRWGRDFPCIQRAFEKDLNKPFAGVEEGRRQVAGAAVAAGDRRTGSLQPLPVART